MTAGCVTYIDSGELLKYTVALWLATAHQLWTVCVFEIIAKLLQMFMSRGGSQSLHDMSVGVD